jgi:DNA polymerase
VLDKALVAAGIDRTQVYVTNAVKHFKWLPRGKKRLHSKPSAREAAACRPWLEYEVAALRPSVLVILGATAGQTLLGSSFRVGTSRGSPIIGTRWAPTVVATIHPSAVLRAPDHAARERELAGLIADLKVAAALL